MGEFMFKNLSVKLLPVEGERPGDCGDCTDCTRCTAPTACGNCTNCTECTNCTICTGVTDCGRCTNCTNCSGTTDCGSCTHCTDPTCGVCTCAGGTDVPIVSEPFDVGRRGGDLRAELAAHKERLRRVIARVEEEERKLEERSRPQSIEQIDELKARFVEAIAELDEQRAQLEAGGEPGPR
jgi:hypothetical protein